MFSVITSRNTLRTPEERKTIQDMLQRLDGFSDSDAPKPLAPLNLLSKLDKILEPKYKHTH